MANITSEAVTSLASSEAVSTGRQMTGNPGQLRRTLRGIPNLVYPRTISRCSPQPTEEHRRWW